MMEIPSFTVGRSHTGRAAIAGGVSVFLIRIDFQALLDHLRDTGDAWDLASAEDWLRERGFVERDDGWSCDEQALAQLDRSEVLSQQRL
jgi:hypothetical protein